MTARGLEPFGFQGSPPPPSNNTEDDNNDQHSRMIHRPTEENTTEDDTAQQELQETTNEGDIATAPEEGEAQQHQSMVALPISGNQQQQHQQFAEEASRALSRLQLQSQPSSSSAVKSSNAIIVSNENGRASLNDSGSAKCTDAIVSTGGGDNDENDTANSNNNNTQLVCATTNNTGHNIVHNPQQHLNNTDSYGEGALTVLPPNELSTTTSDAALAANTFTEMIHDGVLRRAAGGGGVGGSGGGGMGGGGGLNGESLCPPGFYVDGSGVVRRSGGGAPAVGGGGGTGSYRHQGNHSNLGGVGSGGYPDNNAGMRGGGGMNNENHHRGMAMKNGSPGNSGSMGGGGGSGGGGGGGHAHYSMAGGKGLVSTSTSRPHGGGQDPLETDVYHDEEEDEEDEDDDDDEEEEEDSSEISASDEDGSWIAWFCGLRGNEFFCEVDEDYIQDDFNLTGLNGLVPYYDYALDMVLDVEMPMEDTLTEEQQEIVESAAEMLYGLIHARYIVTNRGMHAMYEKYRSASFGRCPHVFCQGQPVLPVGLSDLPRNYTVNVFCPRCHGLFFPKSTRQANIDGAYFGTTFPHLYLMNHPVSAACFSFLVNKSRCCQLWLSFLPLLPLFVHFISQDMIPVRPSQQYVPRVYGFKIHQSSLYFRNHEEDPDNRNRRVTRSRQGGGRR